MENPKQHNEARTVTKERPVPVSLPASESAKATPVSTTKNKRLGRCRVKTLTDGLGIDNQALKELKKKTLTVLKEKGVIENLKPAYRSNKDKETLEMIVNVLLASDSNFGVGWKDSEIKEPDTWRKTLKELLKVLVKMVSQEHEKDKPPTPVVTSKGQDIKSSKIPMGDTSTSPPQHMSKGPKGSVLDQAQTKQNNSRPTRPASMSGRSKRDSSPEQDSNANGNESAKQRLSNSSGTTNSFAQSTEDEPDFTTSNDSDEELVSESTPSHQSEINLQKRTTVPETAMVISNSLPTSKKRRLDSSSPIRGRIEERGLSRNGGSDSLQLNRLTSALGLDHFSPMLIIKSQVGRFNHDYARLSEVVDPDTEEPSFKQLLRRLERGPVKFDRDRHAITWRSDTNIRLVIHNGDHFRLAVEQQLLSRREVRLLVETMGDLAPLNENRLFYTFAES